MLIVGVLILFFFTARFSRLFKTFFQRDGCDVDFPCLDSLCFCCFYCSTQAQIVVICAGKTMRLA